MEALYTKYCLHPVFKITQTTLTILQKKSLGETFWSLDCKDDDDLEKYFEEFYKQFVKHYDRLAIDGPSACGKSTLIQDLNPAKINQFFNIGQENNYNQISEHSYIYININEKLAEYPGLVTDRSVISNLAYLMTYYIMNLLANNGLFNKSLHSVCQEFIDIHNLKSLLQNIKAKKLQVLIILDSSFENMAARVNARGLSENSASDVIKPLCKEYHTAQIAAFAYFANYMNYPCIDLNYVRCHFDIKDDAEIFKANKKAFMRVCNFSPFTGVIDLPRVPVVVSSSILKSLHHKIMTISKR